MAKRFLSEGCDVCKKRRRPHLFLDYLGKNHKEENIQTNKKNNSLKTSTNNTCTKLAFYCFSFFDGWLQNPKKGLGLLKLK